MRKQIGRIGETGIAIASCVWPFRVSRKLGLQCWQPNQSWTTCCCRQGWLATLTLTCWCGCLGLASRPSVSCQHDLERGKEMKVCHKVLFLFRLLAVVVWYSGAESLMWGIWEILLVPRLVTMASGLSGTHPNVTQCLCKPLTSRHVSHTVFALYFLALQLSCLHGLGKACSVAGGRLVQ